MTMISAITDVKTAAGITDFGELDTEIAALKTAYDSDPTSVTEAQIDALHDKLAALSTPNLTNLNSLWSAVDQA